MISKSRHNYATPYFPYHVSSWHGGCISDGLPYLPIVTRACRRKAQGRHPPWPPSASRTTGRSASPLPPFSSKPLSSTTGSAGTCYKAANWIHVGKTQGRGSSTSKKQFALPVKDVYLYPLQKNFRSVLSSSH
jgi:hypothetical protein